MLTDDRNHGRAVATIIASLLLLAGGFILGRMTAASTPPAVTSFDSDSP